ncbi:cyanophycin synthetase [Noviherbaspirillum sedimenti]|uniref:Cyanophycin synthetase n=1 Tax=Noviherbaspirillum sedimenti TaxID=2320865 RepID=A0A3A3G5B0_9BURK|nr:cyanophycin synthetase [Noviherbaspirillum sedimenti]RJG02865.1 cyanophycin synthetase [Noviherbaspirillum sedimenti]
MSTKDIQFLRVTHLRGPNIWTYRPVIEAWVDIGLLEDAPSNTIPGLYERLTAWLPGLIEHRCGVGTRGGFLERLREGTWAGHILEHVTLELQTMAGMKTGFGKARETGVRGVYKVVFRTRQEKVGRAALAAARELLLAAINDTGYDIAATVAILRDLVDDHCLGPSTAHIVDAATERNIPFIRLTDGNLVQLGYGNCQRRIWTAETDRTSAIAEGIASDKDMTKSLLQSCGVPVPQGVIVDNAEAAWDEAQDIGLPVVLKPQDGNHGRGVSLDLKTREEVLGAFALAAREGDGNVIVEQFIVGNEHRLLVVGNRVVAVARGETAWVSGDGAATVTQLVDSQLNSDPRRGDSEEFPLSLIKPAEWGEILLELQRQGLTPDSVPAAGQKVLIQRNGNVAFDVTDNIHPEVAAQATLAARVVGLDIAGIDLVAEDIGRPLDAQRAAIIEVNASPGLLAHIKPASGQPRAVGAAIVEHLFGTDRDGRMPVVGITGSQDTALIARLTAWMMYVGGRHVGMASGKDVYVNSRKIQNSIGTGFDAAQRLLINRALEAAVFENGARMILAEGLPYDKCTVGVVTDVTITPDLAEFYIAEPQQAYTVMRTQVDVVLPQGAAVLNAADPLVVEMAGLCDGSVLFYALDEATEALAAHRAGGGRVAFLRHDAVVLAEGQSELAQLPLLPFAAGVAPASVVAGVAAAWAAGVEPQLLSAGLRTFAFQSGKSAY